MPIDEFLDYIQILHNHNKEKNEIERVASGDEQDGRRQDGQSIGQVNPGQFEKPS